VGINDLARATALASVGLSPSTAAKCASRAQDGTSAAGAARCPSTVFVRWTSVAGAASAPGARQARGRRRPGRLGALASSVQDSDVDDLKYIKYY
jgi:hypothetical protein